MANVASGDGRATRPYDLAVVGLGQAGLPLAVLAAGQGLTVLSVDIDEERVASIRSGHSYVAEVSNDDLADVRAASSRSEGEARWATKPLLVPG